jgi:hypothetical protein
MYIEFMYWDHTSDSLLTDTCSVLTKPMQTMFIIRWHKWAAYILLPK